MSSLYQNKYRRETLRLQSWNYGWAAAYFLTLNIKDRQRDFGQVRNGIMHLSEIGKIAEEKWLKTIQIRPDMNLILDAFVIMPDHFHAILIIGENQYNSYNRSAMHCAAIRYHGNKFGPQRKNLASIIRGYKAAVTISARKINPDFKWQRSFYEHIIRNERSFYRIQKYIIENPEKWEN